MWTAFLYVNYALIYQNKYLPGSIYLNFYFDGVAGIIGYCIGKPLYSYCKIKNSFITSYIISLTGLLGIFLFESEIASPYFIDEMGFTSPHEPGS